MKSKIGLKFYIRESIILVILLPLILGIIIFALFNRHELKTGKELFSYQYEYDQTLENPDTKITGVSSANLSADEEKEIQEIIKKTLEGQWLYCYVDKDSYKLDKSIEDLYSLGEYQRFKEKFIKECRNSKQENITEKSILYFVKKMNFTKPVKYRKLSGRVGIIAGFTGIYYSPFIKNNQFGIVTGFGDTHYFLFKKIDNYWKIEKEIWHIKSRFLDETLIIKQLLEQKNNKTPEMEITES